MNHLWREIVHIVERMDTHHWALALVAVIIVGFFCLRGFGSRSGY